MSEMRLTLLAEMLDYPTEGMMSAAMSPMAIGACPNEESAHAMKWFSWFISGVSLSELEELYTRTFDINPVSSLEIGWHLFGEQYERGAFLVRMRGLLRKHGIAEVTELPDHLGYALLLLDKMPREEAVHLAWEILPAVVKMHDALSTDEQKSNPYRDLLLVIMESLRTMCMRSAESKEFASTNVSHAY